MEAAKTYTSKKAAQQAARRTHGKDYASKFDILEGLPNVWAIVAKVEGGQQEAIDTEQLPEESKALEQYEQDLDEAQNPDAPEYQEDAPQEDAAPQDTSAPVIKAAIKAAQKQAPKTRAPRIVQNGVKRPGPGGLCAAVWDYLDEKGNCSPKDMKPVAEARNWNYNNVRIELYQWRKFNGITG